MSRGAHNDRPTLREAMLAYASDTAATEAAIDRVRNRVLATQASRQAEGASDLDRRELDRSEVEAVRDLLAELPSGSEFGAASVRSRLRRTLTSSPIHVPLAPALAGGGLIGLAAAALLAWTLVPTRDGPLTAALASEGAWQEFAPTSEVQLSYRGSGTVGGAVRKPRIDWEVGTLRVEVEPDRGIDLRVDTREAEIRVIGTGFTVERDALGTRVAVAHGQVAVNCSDGGSASLLPGASITCRPTHAAGLLGRARALEASGAGPQPVLESAERGLAAGPSEAVREELELIRIEALAASGREAEALEAVARALPLATVRATELRHVAARVAMRSSGCAAALPHLAALAATPGGAGGPELVQYADCLVAGEQTPQRRARVEDLLARALALNPPAEQAADIRTRLRRVAEQD